MAAKLQGLIPERDNLDRVRDKIGEVLTEESASQQALAQAAGKDPALWKLRVLLESDNPIAKFTGDQVTDFSPIVNVWFDSANTVSSASQQTQDNFLATFNIDIYGYGLSAETIEGHDPGDKLAAIAAQRGYRLVYQILKSGYYSRLDLQGIVGKRMVQSVNAFQPEILNQTVENVQAVRLALNVQFVENALEYQGQNLEIVHVDIERDADGFLLAQAEYDYTTP